MELVSFTVEEITNNALYKHVTRRAKGLMAAGPGKMIA
jgi:hypothetical protein